MPSATYYARVQDGEETVVISFYKEQPGGWKLNLEDESGAYISNGDRWVETLDDLVLQIANFTQDEIVWREENRDDPISFYNAAKRCIVPR
ncbi:hypothetical protein LPB140_00190 [Sphingorhabdus lutea]|uniref:Uncharacterized protein n=1 Tax=Sphingorhabdus lutea TaxID=1913578 RepID=A0A1L3J8T2_9SPHN|nr:hypothetical protein LPB140_00190 [Sphingorhabdus lutea]